MSDEICYFYGRHNDSLARDTAAMRRGFALAALKAAERRLNGAPVLPPGISDAVCLVGDLEW